VTVGHKELKKAGVFLVPGFAKFVVVKKPATKAAEGHQPLHGRGDDVQGQAGPQDRPARPVKRQKTRCKKQGSFGTLVAFRSA